MDTKLKKCKKVICFTAYILAVGAIIYAASRMAYDLLTYGSLTERYEKVSETDYQNTENFRYHITDRLEQFLNIASGIPADGYYWGYDYEMTEHNYAASGTDASSDTEYIEEDEPAEFFPWGGEVNTYAYENYYPYDEVMDYEPDEKTVKKSAEQLHNSLKEDKNLLYSIVSDGKLMYSNMDELTVDGEKGLLPEGYNFLLYFNGDKVKIIKDGEEQDIYGDGIYRENSLWRVPGYRNYKTGEDMKDIRVCIAAIKEPLLYTYSRYGRQGYGEETSELYWMQSRLEYAKRGAVRDLIVYAGGAVCLILYLIFRKTKKEADKSLAGVTGRIWFECKVILLLGIPVGFLAMLGNLMRWYRYWDYSNFSDMEYYGTDVFNEIGGSVQMILQEFFSHPLGLFFTFLCLYLFFNDLKKNDKVWKNSIISKISAQCRTKELTLPAARRVVFNCIPVFVLSIVFGLSALLLAMYCNDSGLEYPTAMFLLFGLLLAALIWVMYRFLRRTKGLAEDLDRIMQRIAAIRKGEYTSEGTELMQGDLADMAGLLDDIGHGMGKAVEEQMKSERMKVELVANVSHDIKTPLTSIISYVEFLKKEEGLPDHVKDYIRILDEKSQRLKNMVQDVFSISKAASGQLPVNMEVLDLGKLLRQTLADMDERMQAADVSIKTDIPEMPVMIHADGQRLYRVFQNLVQNALQYSLKGSRVYITLQEDAAIAVASVKNTSRFEIDNQIDYAGRFTRGDESRTDGGSGLGLSIAQSFTEACGGSFRLETIADLFVVTVSFPKAQTVKAEE